MKSASVLSVLAAGTIAAISTSVCAGSNGTDAVMRSLDQVNRIYTPEKTTHTELLLRLNDLGCHYRVNNRMKADPEDVMKHTFGWFYRLLPDERGIANCFPVTVFFQNREDGRDVIEIDGGSGGDRKALINALKRRWGEPLTTKGRRQNAHYWVFNAGDRTIVLKEMGILRNYEIEILPVSYYDAVKRRIEEEQAKAEAEAAGCRIERDGSLVKTGEGRGEPCFILPGHPALSVEQFKGGLGFMVRYGADGNGVDAMRMKLSALGPVSSYENRGSINHYWQDAGMTVVETGHERHGSPVSFLFISKATFEKELERILQEKAEAEAEHRRENETLQKMF